MPELTLAEFEVIAKLLQSKEPAKTAARLVLVEGKAVKDAVAATGCLQPAVSRIVRRCRESHVYILTAYAKQKKTLAK